MQLSGHSHPSHSSVVRIALYAESAWVDKHSICSRSAYATARVLLESIPLEGRQRDQWVSSDLDHQAGVLASWSKLALRQTGTASGMCLAHSGPAASV